MPSELYRTYEVLIEESVAPTHPKRGKTNKNDGYNPAIHQALRVTNDLFQDAVCYYTIMLVGMCHDENKNPLWAAWVHDSNLRSQIERVVKHLGAHYPKAVFSGARDIGEFLRRCYCYAGTREDGTPLPPREKPACPEDLESTLFDHIKPQMVKVDEKTGDENCSNLMPAANTIRGWLCNPCGNTNLEGMGVYDRLHREFREMVAKHSDGTDWIRKLESSKKGTKQERELAKGEADAKRQAALNDAKLLACVRGRVIEIADERARQLRNRAEKKAKQEAESNGNIEERISALLQEGLENTKGTEKRPGPYFDLFSNVPSESHLATIADEENKHLQAATPSTRFARLQELGADGVKRDDHKFSKPLYRLLWLRDCKEEHWKNAARDVLCYAVENTPKQPAGGTLPYQSRPQEPLFPHFTNCLGIPLKKREQSAWGSFDQSALAVAAEDLFKYRIRTAERVQQVSRLRSLKNMVEERADHASLTKENSPFGKPITARGLAKDARWKGDSTAAKGITHLLAELVKDTLWEETGYRLRSATIGGWSGLRERFLRLEKWAAARPGKRFHRLPLLLDQAVTAEQTENRQGFGSADFFRLLAKRDYHHLWSQAGAATDAAKENGIKDFVHYYTIYSEWMTELADLLEQDEVGHFVGEPGNERVRPISYTFPGLLNRHGVASQRHLRFDAAIGSRMELPLFFKTDDGYEKRDTALTIAARRLKRDRILTPAGDSIAALWCPPLMVKSGAELLKADKAKEEDERRQKLRKELDRLRERTLADKRLPNDLIQRFRDTLSVTTTDDLLRKLEIIQDDFTNPLKTASVGNGYVRLWKMAKPAMEISRIHFHPPACCFAR